MQAIKMILYAFSAFFILCGLLIFLPMDSINGFMTGFGPIAYPDAPIVAYTVKNFFLIIAAVGVLLAVAVRDPVRHQSVLLVLGGTCLAAAVLCLSLGWVYALPPFFYIDAISSAAIGLLVLVYRTQTTAVMG